MKQNLIIFDADEVLFDHLGGLSEFVQSEYGITPNGKYPTDYNLCSWLGVPQEKVQEIIKDFNENSYKFGLLKALDPYAPGMVNGMRNAWSDVKFAVLTKSGTGGHGDVLRRVNIENVYPNAFQEVIIIEMHESKLEALTRLRDEYNVVAFVDDYIQNIDDGVSLGIPSVMLSRPHNEKYKDSSDDFYYVDTWGQLLAKLVILYNENKV